MRWTLAWLLYRIGNGISLLMYDPIGGVLYRPYSWLMHLSIKVQGEGKGPWRKINDR